MQKQVRFLGFTVSQEGVGTDAEKVAALRRWPTPQNLRQSRAFIGLCQYYRHFVPDFSEIAAPLHALTKKGTRFHWSPECEVAFTKLKSVLSDAPILSLPDDDSEYVLDCDASNHSIGAVLSQIQNGIERPICYASQLYSKHEANYNITRKELLAVVTFTKKFRQYLLGRQFRIRTDHAALQWLKRTPEPIGQQARWLEILKEFNYTIEHRPGRQHSNADALSRVVDSVQAAPSENTATESSVDWPFVQQQDEDVGFVYQLVKNQQDKPAPESLTDKSADAKTLCNQLHSLTITSDGTLCHNFQPNGSSNVILQKVVPYALRNSIADELHKGLNGGHLGIRRAKAKLQLRVYWPNWGTSIRLARQRCKQCTRHQRPQIRRQGRLSYVDRRALGASRDRCDWTAPNFL